MLFKCSNVCWSSDFHTKLLEKINISKMHFLCLMINVRLLKKKKKKNLYLLKVEYKHRHEEGMESRIKSPILSLFSLGLLLKFDQTCNLVQL